MVWQSISSPNALPGRTRDNRIRSWLRLPRVPLAPAWVVTCDRDNQLRGYRLRLRWDGKFELKPAALPSKKSCMLLIEQAIPYRRKLQQFPAESTARMALLRTAPDEFPVPPADMLFGMGLHGSEGYVYALPRHHIDNLRERGISPAVVLIADQLDSTQGCLATIEGYFRYGAALDLLQSKRLFSRRALRHIQLGSALALMLLLSATLLLKPDLLSNFLEWRAAALREQGGALPKLNKVTAKMAYAQNEAARLYASKDAEFASHLGKLFATLPSGCSLRSIEYKNATLKIGGRGGAGKTWLIEQGFPAEGISMEDMGAYQRFKAERAIY